MDEFSQATSGFSQHFECFPHFILSFHKSLLCSKSAYFKDVASYHLDPLMQLKGVDQALDKSLKFSGF